jgi:hypothetical protein
MTIAVVMMTRAIRTWAVALTMTRAVAVIPAPVRMMLGRMAAVTTTQSQVSSTPLLYFLFFLFLHAQIH